MNVIHDIHDINDMNVFPSPFPGLRHETSFPIFDLVTSGVSQVQIHTCCLPTDLCARYTLMHKKHTPTTLPLVSVKSQLLIH